MTKQGAKANRLMKMKAMDNPEVLRFNFPHYFSVIEESEE
jgi:hypothetical protein